MLATRMTAKIASPAVTVPKMNFDEATFHTLNIIADRLEVTPKGALQFLLLWYENLVSVRTCQLRNLFSAFDYLNKLFYIVIDQWHVCFVYFSGKINTFYYLRIFYLLYEMLRINVHTCTTEYQSNSNPM